MMKIVAMGSPASIRATHQAARAFSRGLGLEMEGSRARILCATRVAAQYNNEMSARLPQNANLRQPSRRALMSEIQLAKTLRTVFASSGNSRATSTQSEGDAMLVARVKVSRVKIACRRA